MRRFILAALVALSPVAVLAENGVPEARVAISRDTDFPGGDLGRYFDTTLDACQATCLADDRCVAFTFNARSNACFPKSDVTEAIPFAGAISANIFRTDPAVLAAAPARAADLSFLAPADLDRAETIAREIGRYHSSDGFSAPELRAAARRAEAQGDLMGAFKFTGAAIAVDDAAADWVEYARLGAVARSGVGNEQAEARDRVVPALVSAWLRTGDDRMRTDILAAMAAALEAQGRGRLAIDALRLSQSILPRRDLEAELTRVIGLFGFRVAETQVDSDAATPRACVIFNESLVQAGVDYAPYVQLPDVSFTVEVADAQLCIEGVEHGNRYRVTLREGLPAASGEKLVRPVELNLYVRDRAPQARFVSRAYVLPRTADAGIPIETVNLSEVELTLSRVSDRNLLRTIQEGLFAYPLYDWQQDYFDDAIGERIWEGSVAVAQDLNRDVLTRVPLAEPLAGQPAGVYVLTAAVPGADPYEMPAASQWFVLSDLGIASMLGTDGLTVTVHSLATAAPLAGVELQLVNRANAVLGTTTTGADGVALFEPGLTRGTGASEPALLVANAGDDMAFLSLTDPAFDLSDRGVEGREPAGPIDVFLTTDRGVYRAGETVHLTALMRDGAARALTGVPLTAILTRPDGVEYARVSSAMDVAGGHVYALPIAPSAPRGTWSVEVRADIDAEPLARSRFLVEDFLPERIDVDLDLPESAGLTDSPPVGVTATYLFGPPAGDLPIEGEVLLRARDSVAGWPGFVFGRHDSPFAAMIEMLPGGRTDADGRAVVGAVLPFVEGGASQPLEAVVTVRVTEGSGRPVERQAVLPVTPDRPMIGMRPLFDGDVPEGGPARFDLIALGPDLKPEPMAVRWTINRLRTQYQWYSLYGNWEWEPVTHRERVAGGEVMLGAEALEIAAPVDWGRYELVVERTGADYLSASTVFWAGWFGAGDDGDAPDVLQAGLDAASYAVGDTATLRIVPRFAGTALISVLSDRVIHREAVQVTEGENLIPLTVTADWGTGAYVTATVIRPMDEDAGRNPSRAIGLVHAAVDPGDKALSVILEAPLAAAPRERMTVGIDVQGAVPGEAAWVTLAAVDVGILNLTGFESPDPQGYYFGQRKLGVELRDLYGRLIDGMTGTAGEIRSGGDATMGLSLQAPPPTEELVAFFEGPVQVDANGRAEVSFDLPSFNGTVRLMAVAWSERGVGQAEAEVLVRDPVVVTASVPRFMAPGDESRLLLEIVHAEGPAGEMGLTVESAGLDLQDQLIPAAFRLEPEGAVRLSLPFVAGDPGLHEITVAVTTPDGRALTRTLTIPVQVNDPEVSQTLRLSLAPGQTFTFDDAVFDGLIPGSGEATLSVGPLARFDAAGLLGMLDRYPYGCTEQVTSAALPLLYFNDVAQAMGLADAARIEERIGQAITDVLANQSSNGAFGLWGPWSGDMWLDAYVTDFLSRARARGHEVPETAWAMAIDNLRNRVNYHPDFETGGEEMAYALMVLAREGQAAVGDLRYFADERAFAFTTPLASAQLGAALAFYGDQTRADRMFAQAQRQIAALPDDRMQSLWRVDYGTNRRDIAAVLALAVEAGSAAVDADMLSARLAGVGERVSTQEAVWTLMAANALIDDLRSAGITVDGQVPDGPVVRVRADDAGVAPVQLANTGDRETEITVTTFGVPAVPEPAGGQGYAIRRDYFAMDGTPVSPDSVRAGTRLVTVLTVEPFGRQEARLMIADPLPAGFEIDNPSLLRGGDISALSWLDPTEPAHAEFRQDRFLAAVDMVESRTIRLAYIVRAVSPGTFHHPAASVEDMYRPQMRAHTDAGRVTVTD